MTNETIKKQMDHLLFFVVKSRIKLLTIVLIQVILMDSATFSLSATPVNESFAVNTNESELTDGTDKSEEAEEAEETEEAGESGTSNASDTTQMTNQMANQIEIASPSALLMEASTGQVIYEKDADTRRSPASITKIMTLLLIFENLEQGRISLQDEVTTSAYAKSMGGSQVFLEEGEVQTVDTLIKCIAIASGNDASVAMAEKIAGTEEAFVQMMNDKALQLGLKNTHFEDCCGLSSSENHYTTARDIAIMARELIQKYPKIYEYTTIWMEDITHVTKKGEKKFTLSSTNKLLKQYPYATGLKTGSTSTAKYCFCATAKKDDIDMIAVVMAAPDHKVRFDDAKKLLEFGYSFGRVYTDNEPVRERLRVFGGKEDTVEIKNETQFRYLDLKGSDVSKIEKKLVYEEIVKAPIEKNSQVGSIDYYLNQQKIGSVKLITVHDVEKATFGDVFLKVCRKMLL